MFKRFLAGLFAAVMLLAPVAAAAQTSVANGYYDTNNRWVPVTLATPLPVICTSGCSGSGGGGSGGAVYGTDATGVTPTKAPLYVSGLDTNGVIRPVAVSVNGVFASPTAGTSNRVVTKTSLAANTSTTICPTATAPVTTEMFFTTAGVGISLSGGALTTATVGTTAGTTPDLQFSAANTLYTLPVAATNAITAYGAAGVVVCIQTLRQ